MPENYEIDNVDLKILSLLQNNAKKPYTEIAKSAFVSSGTVHVRMNKLEKMFKLRTVFIMQFINTVGWV